MSLSFLRTLSNSPDFFGGVVDFTGLDFGGGRPLRGLDGDLPESP
jgi:hypothetical protein